MPDAARLAVLIDSDNTTASLTTELLEEIAKFGTPTVKRAYGDWTTPQLAGWKEELLRHAIQPMQQFAYTRGKNSTDSALIIDAMDLLYAGNVEGFVIVSSDSDFTRLATRLREAGMTVYGIGRRNTPDRVRLGVRPLHLPRPPAGTSHRPTASRRRSGPTSRSSCRRAISSTSKDDGWSSLGEVGSFLVKNNAAFDARDYGHSKLGELVRAQPYVKVKDVPRAERAEHGVGAAQRRARSLIYRRSTAGLPARWRVAPCAPHSSPPPPDAWRPLPCSRPPWRAPTPSPTGTATRRTRSS